MRIKIKSKSAFHIISHQLARVLPVIIAFNCLVGCSPEDKKMFIPLSTSVSGIDFENKITESTEFNIMTYEYLYNGGGVAVGDVNNDGLPDIYFTANMVPNKLYLNKGNLHFEDVTKRAGVAGRERWKTGVSMADVNGDGLLDIYVCYSGPGSDEARKNELYINNGVKDGVPAFSEKAAEYGLDALGTFTTQVAFFDMDRDGDLDAFMVNHADMFYNAFFNTTKLRHTRHPKFGNRLYRNDNGKFVNISEEAGIYGSGLNFGLGASVSDLNNDGWPDIYVGNDYNEQDFLYINNRNGTFREALKQCIGHISHFSMGNEAADYNNDLRPDIISLDMWPEDNHRQKLLKGPDGYDIYTLKADSGFHYQDMRNMLQVNMGLSPDSLPLFSEQGQMAGISNTDWSWSALLCDLDNDGWKDLYITNGYLRDFTNMDFLKYTYQEEAKKASEEGRKIETWQLVQQMPSTRISNYVFQNGSDGRFNDVTKKVGLSQPSISTGAAYADLDNDGDIDIIVNNINDPASIFENQTNKLNPKHYLEIKLKGPAQNTFGLGAKVTIIADSLQQFSELYTSHGFQSSVEPKLHFGLGNHSLVNKLQVVWPDGKQSNLKNLNADTSLLIDYATSVEVAAAPSTTPSPKMFDEYTAASGINFIHHETSFVDFKQQFLLSHQVSKRGPCLAKADVNGDGLEDVFIGSITAQLFLQTQNGTFIKAASQPWSFQSSGRITDVIFFDADVDKDADLYVAYGGAEFPANDIAYQDKLFINDGKGNFSLAAGALPVMTASAGCVAAADYDKDGDIDLFVGSRVMPGQYPLAPVSYLLRNETLSAGRVGKNGVVKFEYAKDQADKTLSKPGMVTDAVWADLNNDGWPELILCGEFMPITVYENRKGQLINATETYGLKNSGGLWCKLLATDIDNDGDVDLVAGNAGYNTQFKASEKEPVGLTFGDFDKNGSIDPLLCYYIQGKNYPYASLDELAKQIPSMRKKFLKYSDYSDVDMDHLLSEEQKQNAHTLVATQLASCMVENSGNDKMQLKPLPLQAQCSMLFCLLAEDIDNDNKTDLLLAGNYYPWRVQLGRMDANFGLVLKAMGNGNFEVRQFQETGFYAPGDARDMISITNAKGEHLYVVAKNNDKVQVLRKK